MFNDWRKPEVKAKSRQSSREFCGANCQRGHPTLHPGTYLLDGCLNEAGRDAGHTQSERDEVLARRAGSLSDEEDRVDILEGAAAGELEHRVATLGADTDAEEMAEVDHSRAVLVEEGEESGLLGLTTLGRGIRDE